MRKSYLFVNAAIIAAFLMSGCQNQMAATEQASSAEASVSETAEENTSSAGTLSGNTVIGSNFISKSSTLNEIPLEAWERLNWQIMTAWKLLCSRWTRR